MSLLAPVHGNAQRVVFLAATTIAAAVAGITSTPKTGLAGAQYVAIESIFLYGAGGTTTKVWLQTSLDGGATWIDIANHAFTTAALSKVSAVVSTTALAAGATPGDAALADNTIVSGLFGDRFRVKYTTTGTYTGATSLAVYGCIKG